MSNRRKYRVTILWSTEHASHGCDPCERHQGITELCYGPGFLKFTDKNGKWIITSLPYYVEEE